MTHICILDRTIVHGSVALDLQSQPTLGERDGRNMSNDDLWEVISRGRLVRVSVWDTYTQKEGEAPRYTWDEDNGEGLQAEIKTTAIVDADGRHDVEYLQIRNESNLCINIELLPADLVVTLEILV